MTDLSESYRLLTAGEGVAMVERDVVKIAGPDAASYLQGQISQDVDALSVGDSGWSLILQPQGKIDSWFRITRTADDTFVLDTDAGWAEALIARLNRFKLRVDAEITQEPTVAVAATPQLQPVGAQAPDGLTEVDAAAYEVVRIESGIPKMGSELNEDTIPGATGVVDLSASFTKGCYTGQELVARVDSRGNNTPTRLRVLRSDEPLAAGDEVVDADGKTQATVTSAAAHPDGGYVALGYVKRAVEVPGSIAAVSVLDLPDLLP